jgi:hypothetical protein
MAKYLNGILGPFNGKVGTVVGSSWRSIDYMRAKNGKRTGQPTQLQLDQQAKFAAMRNLLQSMSGLINKGFANYAVKQTAMNYALGLNIPKVMSGSAPTPDIAYENLLVSQGALQVGATAAAASAEAGKIKFSWAMGVFTAEDKDTPLDVAVLAAYCPELNRCVYTLAGGERNLLAATLEVPDFSGKKVHTYLSFLSPDGSRAAISRYTGEVTVL